MFCPRCSQEQISEEIKYCSRCGFLLADVAEALKNDGLVKRNVVQSAKDLRKATISGISMMALSAIFVLLTFIFWTPEPNFFVQFNLLIGMLVFIFGMVFIGYSFLIKPKGIEKEETKDSSFNTSKKSFDTAKPTNNLLNEPDLTNIANYSPPKTNLMTNELVGIPSVTDGTTKLLEKDDK